MANLSFLLRASFGMLPNAQKIESKRNELQQEYDKLVEYKASQELKEYLEIKELVDSEEFKKNKKELLALDFKKTEEYQKEQQYLKLSKQKAIVNYFRVSQSAEYQKFLEVESSDALADYQNLQSYLTGQEHKNVVAEWTLKLKEEVNKQKTFQQLKGSGKIKAYFKTLNSAQLKNYNELTDSNELKEFEALKEFTSSKQLQEFKEALVSQLSAEKEKVNRLKLLKNNSEIIAYNKLKDKEGVEKPLTLVEFDELNEYLNSSEYKKHLVTLEYKNTEQCQKENRFKSLQKNKKLVSYFKFQASNEFSVFVQFKDSQELKDFEELEQYVNSPAYKQALESLKYSNSDEFKKEEAYNQLKNSESIKMWEKFRKSKPYLLYKETEESTLLQEYNTLKEFVESAKFQEFKAYMLDKEKWQKTEAFAKETRYNELSHLADIIWYLSVAESKKFEVLNEWKLTFEDDFTTGKIDDKKWMNSFFWGKVLLNDRYVLAGDQHFYTDNKNIEFNGTTLKIITRQEKARGKVWHPLHGFSEKDFDFTSGMLSTAHSFRQKYGKFEAKIKVDGNFPVYQAFWLKGEKIVPEIDVFKFNMDKKNRFQMSSIWGDPSNVKSAQRITSKISGSSFTSDFFIYSLEWAPEKITWKINNLEVFSTTTGIPDEPLFLMLSSGIQKNAPIQQLPAAFEIDWIRCYEKA
jgi:beta-glucanase (GH16 family)